MVRSRLKMELRATKPKEMNVGSLPCVLRKASPSLQQSKPMDHLGLALYLLQ